MSANAFVSPRKGDKGVNDNTIATESQRLFAIKYEGIDKLLLISCSTCNESSMDTESNGVQAERGSNSASSRAREGHTATSGDVGENVDHNMKNNLIKCTHENEMKVLFSQFGNVTKIDLHTRICYFTDKEAVSKAIFSLNGVTIGDYFAEKSDIINNSSMKERLAKYGKVIIVISPVNLNSDAHQQANDHAENANKKGVSSNENEEQPTAETSLSNNDSNNSKNDATEYEATMNATQGEQPSQPASSVLCNCQTKNATTKYRSKFIRVKHASECSEVMTQRLKMEKRLALQNHQNLWTDVDEAELVKAVIDDYKQQRNTYEDCPDNVDVKTVDWKIVASKLSRKTTADEAKTRWKSVYSGSHREVKCLLGDRLIKRPESSSITSPLSSSQPQNENGNLDTSSDPTTAATNNEIEKNNSSPSKDPETSLQLEDDRVFQDEDSNTSFKNVQPKSNSSKKNSFDSTLKEKSAVTIMPAYQKPKKKEDLSSSRTERFDSHQSSGIGHANRPKSFNQPKSTFEIPYNEQARYRDRVPSESFKAKNTLRRTNDSLSADDIALLKNDPWSLAEDDLLRNLVAAFGVNSWERIAIVFQHKHTPDSCAYRWSYIGNIPSIRSMDNMIPIESEHYHRPGISQGHPLNTAYSSQRYPGPEVTPIKRVAYDDAEYERETMSNQEGVGMRNQNRNDLRFSSSYRGYTDNHDENDAHFSEYYGYNDSEVNADEKLTEENSKVKDTSTRNVIQWSEDETSQLLRLVKKYGTTTKSWETIVKELGTTRSVSACRNRYIYKMNYAKKDFDSSDYATKSNEAQHFDDADEIISLEERNYSGPHKNSQSSSQRQRAAKSEHGSKWSEQELDQLESMIIEHGESPYPWDEFAERLGTGRTPKALKSRYLAVIAPKKNQMFHLLSNETQILTAATSSSSTSTGTSSRSDQKSNKKWSEEELDLLFQHAFGKKVNDWNEIADKLGNGRTGVQCRAVFDYYTKNRARKRIREPAISSEPKRKSFDDDDDEEEEDDDDNRSKKRLSSKKSKPKQDMEKEQIENYSQHASQHDEQEPAPDEEDQVINNEFHPQRRYKNSSKIYYME